MLKKFAVATLSLLVWLSLTLAVLFTSLTLSLNELDQSGDIAVSVLEKISTNEMAISSIFDEIKKSTNPSTRKEFEKNRVPITKAIVTLSSTIEFKDFVATSLNDLSQGLLSGASNVSVDFSKIAPLFVNTINKSAKKTIITKRDLNKFTLKKFDISKQSEVLSKVRSKVHLGLIFWIIWALMLLGFFFLKREALLRILGWNLFSLGLPLVIFKFLTPFIAGYLPAPAYLRANIPQLVTSIFGPMFIFGITLVTVGGAVLIGRKISSNRFSKDSKANNLDSEDVDKTQFQL